MLKRFVPVVALLAVIALAACSGPGSPAKPGAAPKKHHSTASTGCGLVSETALAKIAGMPLGHGVSVPLKTVTPTKQIPVIANQSCSYNLAQNTYLQYFINTLSTPAAAYETKVWQDDMHEEPQSVPGAIDGLPSLLMTESEGSSVSGSGFIQFIFYKGQQVVQINTEGMPTNAAQAIAKLIIPKL